MSAAQHTPGPWHVGGEWRELVAVYDSRSIYIAQASTGIGAGWIGANPLANGVAAANARLIAAAPDLLAALQAILHPDNEALVYFVPCDAHANKLRDDAIAAIAKATGAAA